MKLSIIIPAHNEEKAIGQVLEKVLTLDILPWEKEVVIVNDGSTDRTMEVVKSIESKINGREKQTLLINHPINLGKGAAIKSALEKVTGDYVVIQDADGEYEPLDIINLLSLIPNQEKQIAIFGNRGIKSYPERGFHYVVGAKLLTWTFNFLYGIWLHDLYTGYKLIPANILKSLNLKSQGFDFEAEVACKLRKKGCNIVEVPITHYRPRSKQQGKHIRFKDAIIGMWAIIKYRIS